MICKAVVDAITLMLDGIQDFDAEFRKIVESEAKLPDASLHLLQSQVDAEERRIAMEKQNYLNAIAMLGPDSDIADRLNELKARASKLAIRKAELDRQSISESDLPTTPEELATLLRESFLSLTVDSYEFGAMLPKIVPELHVHCVRLCNGGPLLPRAKFKIDLSGSFESEVPVDLKGLLVREFTIDIFEKPKVDLIRSQVCELSKQGMNIRQIAANLPIPVSEKVVSKTLAFQSKLDDSQLGDPYVLQLDPPDDLKKQRRHRHPRYAFSFEDGYEPSPIS